MIDLLAKCPVIRVRCRFDLAGVVPFHGLVTRLAFHPDRKRATEHSVRQKATRSSTGRNSLLNMRSLPKKWGSFWGGRRDLRMR
jgi:hypothetical protein